VDGRPSPAMTGGQQLRPMNRYFNAYAGAPPIDGRPDLKKAPVFDTVKHRKQRG
jgi:hypothetical protein